MSLTRSPRFGANYTPSHHWMHAWLELSPDAVRRDFAALAELGLDHVRIFPLWTLLQPNRTLVREAALDDVRTVVDIAAEFDLDVSVDAIQGHLSSFDFVPSWLATWHDRNMFTDPDALSGQVELVRALAGRLADAENFLGLTLGNEVNQFSDRTHPHPWPISTDEAETWLTTLLGAADETDPVHEHVHSEYDAVWYMDDHPFVPTHASRLGAMTTIHSWIFNGTAQRFGGRSTAADRHAEYLIEISRAFASDPARPIWLQEVGAPSSSLEPSQMPDFLEATVRSAVTTENLWGVTWWCSHDVSRSLADFPDLEYSLGLIDQEGRAKPIGRRFAELIGELRAGVEVPARSTAIEIAVDEHDLPLSRAALGPRGAVFAAWLEALDDGRTPTFVLSNEDAATRRARGIREVIVPRDEATDAPYDPRNTVV